MKTIKVGLVQINNIFVGSYYFPLSAGLLQAYFQKHSKLKKAFEFLDLIFCKSTIDGIVKQLEEADIVGFSLYAWNYCYSMEIAKRLKQNNQEIIILVGGPHVPDNSEKFLKECKFVDLACHGEGEEVFREVLENYHSRNWKDIRSISYMENETFICQSRRPRMKNYSMVPSPYLAGVFDNLMRKFPKYEWMVLWETNRGCPYKCAFCDWGSAIATKLYNFEMDRLINEIQWCAKNKISYIYCCDANFGILKRDLKLARVISETKRKFNYPKSLAIHDAKNATNSTYQIQKVLHDGGLSKGVSLALQSVNDETLKLIGRKNIPVKTYTTLQHKFNTERIETYTEYLLGLPGETYNSFTNGVKEIIEMGQHNRIRFGTLTILPNAEMGDPQYQKKHEMLIVKTRSRSQHSTLEPQNDSISEFQQNVVGTKTMPKGDWVKAKVFTWWCSLLYYNKLLQIPMILLHDKSGADYKEMFENFFLEDNRYPVISDIHKFFKARATDIQNGGDENSGAKEWLNLNWPSDEYIFIKLIFENKIGEFYREAQKVLCEFLEKNNLEVISFLDDAVILNQALIKQPFQKENIHIQTTYNIWESYLKAVSMVNYSLERGNYDYMIDCSSEVWQTWDEWFREVVWYGNRQGDYLYKVKSVNVNTKGNNEFHYSIPQKSFTPDQLLFDK